MNKTDKFVDAAPREHVSQHIPAQLAVSTVKPVHAASKH